MEIEGILSHGCEKALRELLSVKSDYQDAKSDLIRQLISTGQYVFPEKEFKESGGTKKVVEKLIQFMRM